jgi:hypothetical protein
VDDGDVHGALAMTTPGHTSMASSKEVGAYAKVERESVTSAPRVFRFEVIMSE